MSTADEIAPANQAFVAGFAGSAPKEPVKRTLVVTCMDSRLDLLPALGLEVGDAHFLRNAGGLVTPDVLRSIAISQRALGTREVVLVHHTQCGMQGFDDAGFRTTLADETGETPDWDVPGFSDPVEDTRQSVERVRQCPWLPHRDAVRGFVYDVQTGAVTAVG